MLIQYLWLVATTAYQMEGAVRDDTDIVVDEAQWPSKSMGYGTHEQMHHRSAVPGILLCQEIILYAL